MIDETTNQAEREPQQRPTVESLETGHEKELSDSLARPLEAIDVAIEQVRLEMPDQTPNSIAVIEATQNVLLHNAEDAIIQAKSHAEVIDDVEAASTFGLLRFEGMLPISDGENVIKVMQKEGLGDELAEVTESFADRHVIIGTTEAAIEMKKIMDAHPDIDTETNSQVEFIEAPRPERGDLGKPEAKPTLKDFEVNAEKRKEDVDALFKESPDLEVTGNKEQYEDYLSTIFPESKIQSILYHGTGSMFEEFNTRPQVRNGSKFVNEASFFTTDISLAQSYKREAGELKRVLLDIRKPMKRTRVAGVVDLGLRSITAEVRRNLQAQGYDSVVNMRYEGEVGVFESDVIHTLGSQKDIMKFAEYVDTLKTPS